MAANPDGTWELIDGVQRLSTLIRFVGDAEQRKKIGADTPLRLQQLAKLDQFNDKIFSELPGPIQLQFRLKPLKVTTITDKSDVAVRKLTEIALRSLKLEPAHRIRGFQGSRGIRSPGHAGSLQDSAESTKSTAPSRSRLSLNAGIVRRARKQSVGGISQVPLSACPAYTLHFRRSHTILPPTMITTANAPSTIYRTVFVGCSRRTMKPSVRIISPPTRPRIPAPR